MINLHYVRAAIEANTGVHLSLVETRQYLLEEGLITQRQADEDARIFTGYDDFFEYESFSRDTQTGPVDDQEGLPE